MKISSEKKYDVLDNRAATYEKLVDWKAALRDAKAMIKEDKTVAKDIDAPYLRHVALVPYWELYDTCGRSLQRFPSLEHVELDRSLLCHLPFLPATVRSISVNGCDSYFRNTPPFNPHEPVPHVPAEFDLPNLESIEACGTTIIPPIMLGLMLSSAKTKMRRVLLNASGGDYQPPLVEASRNGYLTNLTMLGLAGQSMTDDGVVAIAQGAPNLEHVNLSSTAVSGISVKALLERPDSKIKLLSVDNCSYLNPDAVEYARAKGVHVNFSFPDPKRRATKPTGHIYVV
ncbi:MAG: hypothetical protein M1815_002647 [Lichina confinis]|nr:MAG: hypothetical protein M1815_002647 [Lichina confinis]